ncbi:asparaginase [Alcaligenes faecalis]|uniref:asparaginase n=1 Tax=Alcaligenes faecalis TaxID=511 RepID=UPI0024BCE040|nr:asparaginase [Alcaligenes faecalis]
MPIRPKLALVGTGGTIAATTQSNTGLTDYDITQGVHTLLQAVPGINELADLECHQVFNVDSRAMGSLMLLELSHKLNELLARPDINGAVVTHGTDTLEESAFFLHLTLKTDKPVVMVAAMRPASALSADGPLNLYQAVQVACSSLAQDQGVLVLLNDQIHSARFLSKQHTTLTSAFGSPDAGPLGLVAGGQPRFMMRSLLPHTHSSLFDVRSCTACLKFRSFTITPIRWRNCIATQHKAVCKALWWRQPATAA